MLTLTLSLRCVCRLRAGAFIRKNVPTAGRVFQGER